MENFKLLNGDGKKKHNNFFLNKNYPRKKEIRSFYPFYNLTTLYVTKLSGF